MWDILNKITKNRVVYFLEFHGILKYSKTCVIFFEIPECFVDLHEYSISLVTL